MTSPSRSRAAAPALPPFERVLEQHGRAVLRFCVAEAGQERGEDCFQETVLAALRAYAGLRDPDAVRAWLGDVQVKGSFPTPLEKELLAR